MGVDAAGGSGPYAPRNAINAEAIWAAIDARSRSRGDTDEVRAWMCSHFFRHVVSNLPTAVMVPSLEQARDLLGETPAWLASRFEEPSDVPIVWVDPTGLDVLELEAQIVEFLRSRTGTPQEGKLQQVNCPQALAMWQAEHARMAEFLRRGRRQSHPEALREVCQVANGRLVELIPDGPLLRDEMAFESYAMGHCLGQFADKERLRGGYGQQYVDAVLARQMRLFSLRDHRGEPHVTMSLLVHGGGLRVDQIKGKQNRRPVAKYVGDVLAGLVALDVGCDDLPIDCVDMGVVHDPDGWQRVADITDVASLTALVGRYPQLYAALPDAPPALEWLIAARAPQLLQENPPKSPTVRMAMKGPVDAETLPPAMVAGPSQTGRRGFGVLVHKETFSPAGATDYTGWHLLPLALAAPMVDAIQETHFYDRDVDKAGPGLAASLRPQFLHQLGLPAYIDDAAVRRHFAEAFPAQWYRMDLPAGRQDADPRASLAFAVVRTAFLARNAVLLGWVSDDLARRVLLLNGRRAWESFTGWDDFGRAYLAGRAQWFRAGRADPLGANFDQVGLTALLTRARYGWKSLPWPIV